MLSLLLMFLFPAGNLQQAPQNISDKIQNQSKTLSSQVSVIENQECLQKELRVFNLKEIEGVKVNILLYIQTKQIIKEARANSLPLSLTSTYRTCQEQIQLRDQNCPSPTSPVEACSPPTEKAGDSLHNYAMAVDFKCEGYPIFGNSPCYTWLKENAPKLKLKQRAEEPWHWSLTGR